MHALWPQAIDRTQFAQDFYVLGDQAAVNYTRGSFRKGEDAYEAVLHGLPYSARPLDYGAVYASKSYADMQGRRLWLGWVFEVRHNATHTHAHT